ncbi:Variant-specific surface protein [Giardia duodenalis]|uniref:Variant-specific surface protein n=1 Tax=Giardia intestinalis TaxID=5741 RepID=V6TPH8_GIAIN|nr:Variant-specific surface protein [Giardia intestinalis]
MDPLVNKGGLSSGAIAGISVAVVVVVGGLGGFLCWWFIGIERVSWVINVSTITIL